MRLCGTKIKARTWCFLGVKKLKLETFSVENYRSITEARRIPLSNATVLLGPNNEGKSNILRALNAAMLVLTRSTRRTGLLGGDPRLLPPSRREFMRAYDWSKDFPISLAKGKSLNKTRITLEFSLDSVEIDDFRREIKSSLNGTLPVCITFSEDDFDIKIVKQGKGGSSLNAKSGRIAAFLADRIQFQYIPAVRTAQEATRVVESIIAAELAELERKPEYKEALSAIKKLQKPILDAFSKKTTETLKAFLPEMRSVRFSVSDERRYTALRQSIDIEVDDGAVTSLEAKGDGVQSLVALGLRRHFLEESRERRTYIFAVEEPEAHLHPNAIHELRGVLRDLSKIDQVIITTHSGLLANRSPISSNIIVNRSKASPAKSLGDIRSALGIRSHDNLINAELVLLVEGDDDKLALRAILGNRSQILDSALHSGRVIIDSLDGAGSLGAKIGLYKGILCRVHCFLDDDASGRSALEKAQKAGLIDACDFNLALVGGKAESEFEDMLDEAVYANHIVDRFGVDLRVVKPRNRKAKWSARMADAFLQAGKPFGDLEKQRIKFVTADAVAGSPEVAVVAHAEGVITSLVASLEAKLKED